MKPWLLPVRRKAWSGPMSWDLEPFRYPFSVGSVPNEEKIENDFEGYVNGAFKSNGTVYSCVDRRQQVFSQGRFQFRRYRNGQPQDYFGTQDLAILERPWPKGTTGKLLAYMEYDASLAGNFYATTVDGRGRVGAAARPEDGRRIVRMRPDWTTLILGSVSGDPYGVDAEVIGYKYEPRTSGGGAGHKTWLLLPSEVCHYAPIPDPIARFRGMSWLTPVIREISADKAATKHKLKFFQNGASPALAVRFDKDTAREDFLAFVEMFNAAHRGTDNAFKTVFLANGADVTPLTMDFRALDLKAVQGAGETRLAVAAGVPAPILGISEGLSGSSLNQGNFDAARRLFVDTTITDLWSEAAPALSVFVTVPGDAQLEVDGREIPFLREAVELAAQARSLDATTLRTLIDAGYNPDAAASYLKTGDLSKLIGQHSGLYSVQLRPPGAGEAPADQPSSTNGRVNGAPALT